MGTDMILYDTLSLAMHHTQIVLGNGISLFGSEGVPLHRSLIVLGNTLSVVPRLNWAEACPCSAASLSLEKLKGY